MTPSEHRNFPDRIRTHRQRTSQTQQQLADRLDVSRLTIINWENGTWPGRNLRRLVDELRTSEEGVQGQDTDTDTQEETPINKKLSYQLRLPFEEPIDLLLKIAPGTADTLHVEVRFERKTS
jgi:DNA-binding XRE family transcriptional regulator